MNILKILIAYSMLLLTSQAALAVVEFDSVVIDPSSNTILVTGSGFTGLTPPSTYVVSLGVQVIPAGDITVLDDNHMTLNFSTATAAAVPEQGSYSLRVDDLVSVYTFSAYFDSAIIAPPVSGSCPCQGIWDSYGSKKSPRGFADLVPSCEFLSPGGDQVAVQFWNPQRSQLWVLTSEFNGNAQECALVFDEPTVPGISQTEHDDCSTYLQTNYFGTGAPACTLWPPIFPEGLL